MKRTTISLPDDLAALVEREAHRREVSVSELVRLALARLLRPEGGRELPWAGVVREPEMVYGADLDEALAEEWARGDAARTATPSTAPPRSAPPPSAAPSSTGRKTPRERLRKKTSRSR
ncbi:MAG TPA: CopG family transcriptional regulator [Thermoanaerobaculia bacterium]|nr:CopG family transcriptional regulator [Thermoanaerobaculia bacterium]